MTGPAPESTLKTLGFAAVVALLCALLVSTAVHWLRPIQYAAASLGQVRAVLEAAQMMTADEALADGEVIDRFLTLERRILDLESGDFTSEVNPVNYDYRSQVADRPKERPRYIQVYLMNKDGRLAGVVLPFYARGMWSTIHGHVALEADLATVAGITIDEHGETPGIGDRIQAPQWLEGWRGKRIYDQHGRYFFRITSGPESGQEQYAVDAITGATVTVKAVDRAIAEWFGSDGYGPFLATLREEGQ